MDKIAVISDIHGNIPALEAVFKDSEDRGAARIFCLGDLVGKGPGVKEAIDLCKDRCEIIVKGNWDDYVYRHAENADLRWYREAMGRERLDYLDSLPLKIEFFWEPKRERLFHSILQSALRYRTGGFAGDGHRTAES